MENEEIVMRLVAVEKDLAIVKETTAKYDKLIDAIHDMSTSIMVLVNRVDTLEGQVTNVAVNMERITQQPGKDYTKLKWLVIGAVVSGSISLALKFIFKI